MIGLVKNPKLLSMITIKLAMLFVGGIICLGCYPEIRSGILFTPTPVPPAPTKQMISSDFLIAERWRWKGLTFNSIIVTSENKIILANDYWGGENIIVFDAHTGSIIWESENINSINSLHADDKRVYIGSILHVRAYDLETGQVLWEGAKQPRYKRGGFNVYSKGDQLEVYDSYNSRFYVLDSETGQTIEETLISLPFFRKGNIYYSGSCGTPKMNCLQATDLLNGETLWSYKFEGGVYNWPIFVDSTMFVNGGGRLHAIDTRTGDLVWQSKEANFVTKVVLSGGLLYSIRNDAAVVGLNPETGELVGLIEITPNRTPRENNAGYTTYYTIGATDKFIAAYYGNSQELIVFERMNSTDQDN